MEKTKDGENERLLNRQAKKYGSTVEKHVTVKIIPASDEKPTILLDSNGQSLFSESSKYATHIKMAILVLVWIGCTYALMVKSARLEETHQLSIPKNSSQVYLVSQQLKHKQIMVNLEGALLPKYYAKMSKNTIDVWMELLITKNNPKNLSNLIATEIVTTKRISEIWRIPLVSKKMIGVVPEVKHRKTFDLNSYDCFDFTYCFISIKLSTTLDVNFPVSLGYNLEPIDINEGVIYAALVLLFLYVLIIFELVHKTLAAMITSTLSIAVLALLNAKPTTAEIISWIDFETMSLLFSMMTLVAVFSETGIFDYMAVFAYKVTAGKIWPLINTLCFFTAVLSCFLDNVTTTLLMTPVCIRLCEVIRINPVPVLISIIIYSNIGGTITPIGDPPNVIIASNSAVIRSGINFAEFTLHMGVGVIFATIVVYIHLRIIYRNINDLRCTEPNDVQDLRREIEVWKKTAASLGSYTKDENIVKETLEKRTTKLVGKLNTRSSYKTITPDDFEKTLQHLQATYPIKDKVLLIKSAVVMSLVIIVFFLHSIPETSGLGLGLTAMLGALILLILWARDDIDAILAKVEWSALLFFASLFVLMEALSKLGLIEWIGEQTQTAIMSVEQESRLTVAILIILWVSAFASAFVDNIPLTTMMIKIITGLVDDRKLNLPLQPLIWALAFGACLGGNGTLLGSSCNIVCAGVAEQHGYKISFMHFMKVGFPVMITSTCAITIYLLVAHVVCFWH